MEKDDGRRGRGREVWLSTPSAEEEKKLASCTFAEKNLPSCREGQTIVPLGVRGKSRGGHSLSLSLFLSL